MKASSKTVLFSRITVNKAVHQWPIGIFANPTSAKTYAAYVKMAHSSGLVELAKKLDPKTRLTEDGKLMPGVKFSIVTLPYEPSPGDGIGDDDLTEESPTE